jgi:hypothetical protein
MLASDMYSGCMALRDRTRTDNIMESYDKINSLMELLCWQVVCIVDAWL